MATRGVVIDAPHKLMSALEHIKGPPKRASTLFGCVQQHGKCGRVIMLDLVDVAATLFRSAVGQK